LSAAELSPNPKELLTEGNRFTLPFQSLDTYCCFALKAPPILALAFFYVTFSFRLLQTERKYTASNIVRMVDYFFQFWEVTFDGSHGSENVSIN
jgi:hypothetical protein